MFLLLPTILLEKKNTYNISSFYWLIPPFLHVSELHTLSVLEIETQKKNAVEEISIKFFKQKF